MNQKDPSEDPSTSRLSPATRGAHLDGPQAAPATRAVHLGRPCVAPGSPVNPHLVLSSTFHQGGDTSYARDGNPTWVGFEALVGGLEGGSCLTFSSGMAAIAAVVETLPIPGRVVVAADAYNGTRRFFADLAGRGRLRFRTVDLAATGDVLSVCSEVAEAPGRPSGSKEAFGSGGLLWVESPTNPLLSIADIEALARGAHDLGMDVVVDNTFASPIGQQPLDLGADVVVHSATKILSGHSDALIGAVVTRRDEILEQLAQRRSLHGAIPGSLESWLALRGARTLSVRQAKAAASAGLLAERLIGHQLVSRVYYPGLASHPGHELAVRQMSDFGTMVSFEVVGGARCADALCGAVRLLTVATSLGGVETLIERRSRWAGEEAIPPGLLRMSVGIEDVEDLWADLSQGLQAVEAIVREGG